MLHVSQCSLGFTTPPFSATIVPMAFLRRKKLTTGGTKNKKKRILFSIGVVLLVVVLGLVSWFGVSLNAAKNKIITAQGGKGSILFHNKADDVTAGQLEGHCRLSYFQPKREWR